MSMGAIVNLKEEACRRKTGQDGSPLKTIDIAKAHEVDELIQTVTKKITSKYGDLVNEVNRGEKETKILGNIIEKIIVELGIKLGEDYTAQETVKKIMDTILGYGVLQPYINDPQITDIFVNGHDNVYKRVKGQDITIPEVKWKDNQHLEQYIRSVLIKNGRKIHSGIPLADARDMKKRLRINVGIPPVAKKPYLTLRKHTVFDFNKDDFLNNGTFTQEVLNFIQKGVEARLNLLIAGPTGSGKTTLMRFLAEAFIPADQRVVVLEEEEELFLRLKNLVTLEAKKKSGEEDTSVEMDDMVKNSLRMAMRRIILGELRGKEAFTLLRAFGTGHDGGMTTIHANDTYNAVEQLAVCMLFANTPLSYMHLKRLISQSIDLMVYVENQRVIEVTSLDGFDEVKNEVILSPVFVSERDQNGELQCKSCSISDSLRDLFWQRGMSL